MPTTLLIAVLLFLTVVGYYFGRSRSLAVSGGAPNKLHSLPSYHGAYVALWCGLPSLLLVAAWLVFEPVVAQWILLASLSPESKALGPDQLSLLVTDIKNLAQGNIVSGEIDPSLQAAADGYSNVRSIGHAAMVVLGLAVAILGLYQGRKLIQLELRARNQVERIVDIIMIVASTIAILTTIGIVLSLLFEAMRFFARVPLTEFLFGLNWSPQTALRAEQVGSSGAFGAVPLFAGTLLITLIAMAVAAPIGLFSAIYMSEYAGPRLRATVKPLLEILAGVPTVVYGFFAALTVAPFFRGLGESVGLSVSSESALAAGAVMGIMIIPFVSSLSDDVMNAVAPDPARRRLCARRDQVRDHQASDLPGGSSGHRRRPAPRRQSGDRRNHDRGDGRRSCGQSDGQPVASGHHRDRPDRHPACRRSGIRQCQDPGSLRARLGALRRHSLSQRRGPPCRPEVQRKI